MSRAGVIAVVAALLGVNAFLLRGALDTGGHPAGGLWDEMATVSLPTSTDAQPLFPESLRSKEGERVTLSGVAFLMNAGVENDQVRWFVLMPPSRYGCCGISCDPKPELSVYVDSAANPWTASGRKQLTATVEGVLRLQRGADSWCLYTLEDAVVRPAEP